MTILVLLNIAGIFVIYPTASEPFTTSLQILLSLKATCLLLLGILIWLQFRRTQTFYHHCKIQWAASQAPQPEPHP
jgi:hypothetical protein